ncbi:hypothetical protein RhiirA5_346503 [Rhizophagus irregularis]|nr:hypothetical protein RhiirA5_346503 [Rhizophagus irregularis]PKC74273.1 hypothetical protein RhiirA1_409432 [Rhizophagus irregularis]PKY16119.1 hypothetical protein RhiirB3_402531 [Rhizophagus irregularis]PKY41093.1 hypothetical protein RhiirA4_395531 [Rhizophagus irregularis]CAB4421811.1 unnamed protein product [Rhizophagus irregularis]
MKFFSLLLITIALIATFVVASPTPNEGGSKEIHVSSPGSGPWAVKSTQAINWWSLNIPSDSIVIVKVIDKSTDKVVFEDKSKCGTGTINFEISEDWNVKHEFIAVVYLKDNEECKGFSEKFKIFKTEEYGYGGGYKKEY